MKQLIEIKKKDPRQICFCTTCFAHDGDKHCNHILPYINERGICGAWQSKKKYEEMVKHFEDAHGVPFTEDRFVRQEEE